MPVRWRNVIPLSSALIMFVLTCHIVTQLPTDTYDEDQDIAQGDGRSGQVLNLRLFPEVDRDDSGNVETKYGGMNRDKRADVRRREKALLLFEEEDLPEAERVAPNGVEAQPDDIRGNDKDAELQRHEGLVEQRLENHDAERNRRDIFKDEHDDDSGRLLVDIVVRRNVPKEVDSGVDDRHDPVYNRADSRQPAANDGLLLHENIRAVGAIVQRLRQPPVSNHGAVAEIDTLASPVNPHPFRYIINCPQLCADAEDLFVIVYVHSTLEHYKRRTVIRQTWGDASQYDVSVRVVFVMGVHAGSGRGAQDAQTALAFEAERYQDIVQEDFVDSEHNLTYKAVAALRWIDTYCSQAAFVLKTDDDIFVNMFALLRYSQKAAREQQQQQQPRPSGLLMCCVWTGLPVLPSGNWKVMREEWPDDSYPTYCTGGAFVMSTDVAVRMHRASYDVPFFWIDDLYITGLLPLKLANVTHRQFASGYVFDEDRLEDTFTGTQWYLYVFSQVHNLDRIQTVWDSVVQLAAGKIRPHIARRTILRQSSD